MPVQLNGNRYGLEVARCGEYFVLSSKRNIDDSPLSMFRFESRVEAGKAREAMAQLEIPNTLEARIIGGNGDSLKIRRDMDAAWIVHRVTHGSNPVSVSYKMPLCNLVAMFQECQPSYGMMR